ncbi:hypothetical protein PV371_16910 [Streptomyces sp. TX20-6-3]|uniref:hypothetical protein n=1 Tax=Streptomyces sp. TX20-6-3 TaxID=3028705 RepID=UPI0029B61283|nr:hypothetical protein [Streptomyces sp. TX20-6-3]MDX2561327.1 hypothetical protein [Streptomyces sp. TX20-6-3]
MPIVWALANPRISEGAVLAAIREVVGGLMAARVGIPLITDKDFASQPFEKDPTERGIELLRPPPKHG